MGTLARIRLIFRKACFSIYIILKELIALLPNQLFLISFRQCSYFMLPENPKKPLVFWCFQEVQIWSHLLKKSLMKNFMLCVVDQ